MSTQIYCLRNNTGYPAQARLKMPGTASEAWPASDTSPPSVRNLTGDELAASAQATDTLWPWQEYGMLPLLPTVCPATCPPALAAVTLTTGSQSLRIWRQVHTTPLSPSWHPQFHEWSPLHISPRKGLCGFSNSSATQISPLSLASLWGGFCWGCPADRTLVWLGRYFAQHPASGNRC